MVLRDKKLKQDNHRIAVVRSAITHNFTIGPNKSVTIMANTDKGVDFPDTSAMLHETKDAAIQDYLDVTPVIRYQYRNTSSFCVTLMNLTTNTAIISPKEMICQKFFQLMIQT